jgi:hypothetical protein
MSRNMRGRLLSVVLCRPSGRRGGRQGAGTDTKSRARGGGHEITAVIPADSRHFVRRPMKIVVSSASFQIGNFPRSTAAFEVEFH